jgi:hypothetical protein
MVEKRLVALIGVIVQCPKAITGDRVRLPWSIEPVANLTFPRRAATSGAP